MRLQSTCNATSRLRAYCSGDLEADADLVMLCSRLVMSICAWHAGHDDLLLAVGQAAQPLFAATPEPARMQPCMGCKPVLKAVNVTWDGQGVPEAGDTTSSYTLGWSGECDLSPGAGSAADSKTEL